MYFYQDEVNVAITNEDLVTFEVWDHDILGSDKMIGDGSIALLEVFKAGQGTY